MARAIWSGVITFGLVSIPVSLLKATESHNIAFHLLHKKCDTRIKELKWCPHCEKELQIEDIVKGYEYTDGEYVEVTAKDFEELPLPSKNTISLVSFVKSEQIDPIYFDASYYVSIEQKGAQKPYKLLIEAMAHKEVVAVASISLRNREKLCMLRVVHDRLYLHTLLYEDEIRENSSDKPSSVAISAKERKIAESLIGELIEDFDPSSFKDHYQEALDKLIKAKLKGTKIRQPKRAEAGEIVDLMEALKQSIANAKGARTKTKTRKVPAPASKRTRKV